MEWKRKEIDLLENIIFKGEYINDNKNGYIKYYDSNHDLKFEGNLVNRLKNGNIKE